MGFHGEASEGCRAVAHRAKAGCASASFGSASDRNVVDWLKLICGSNRRKRQRKTCRHTAADQRDEAKKLSRRAARSTRTLARRD
jgi:hypothetical protein